MPIPTLPSAWTTERLRLRPFHCRDVEDVLAFANDLEWGRYLPVPHPYELRDAEAFLAVQILANPVAQPRWALEYQGKMVGSVELALEGGGLAGTLHFAIARPLWGRGLTSEAVGSVVDRAFEGLPGLFRIASHADVRNTGSWKVMEKVGLSREGLLRSVRFHRGERIDDVVYGIVREEWETRRTDEKRG